MNRLAKITIISFGVAVLVATPSFAMDKCIQSALDSEPALSETGGEGTDYPVKCSYIADENGEKVAIYGKTSADCAKVGSISSTKCITAEEGVSSSDDEQTDIAPAPAEEDPGEGVESPIIETIGGTETTGETAKKEDEKPPVLLIVSLVANGVLLLAVIVLIVMLSKKCNALSAANATIASTQVVPPHGHNSQIPYTPKEY